MPREDEYDDYDDYEEGPKERGPAFPVGVRLAGIVWIGFGALGILTSILSYGIQAGNMAQGGQARGNACSGGCSILFSVAFLVVGVQTVRGTAKGTVANGIGSLVFGLLYAGLTVFAFSLAGRFPAANQELMFVLAGMSALLSLSLLVAGVLAIAGRQGYADWLQWRKKHLFRP